MLTNEPTKLFVVQPGCDRYHTVDLREVLPYGARSAVLGSLPDGRAVVHAAGSGRLCVLDPHSGRALLYSTPALMGASRDSAADRPAVVGVVGTCVVLQAGASMVVFDIVAGRVHRTTLPTGTLHGATCALARAWLVKDSRGLHALQSAQEGLDLLETFRQNAPLCVVQLVGNNSQAADRMRETTVFPENLRLSMSGGSRASTFAVDRFSYMGKLEAVGHAHTVCLELSGAPRPQPVSGAMYAATGRAIATAYSPLDAPGSHFVDLVDVETGKFRAYALPAGTDAVVLAASPLTDIVFVVTDARGLVIALQSSEKRLVQELNVHRTMLGSAHARDAPFRLERSGMTSRNATAPKVGVRHEVFLLFSFNCIAEI